MRKDHSLTRRRALQMGAGLLAPAMLAGGAVAQETNYPTRDIRVICAFPPGSGADVLARFFAEGMRPFLGKSIIVENRVGASGNLATIAAARAKPDGYTLFIHGGNSVAANMSLFKDPGIDAAKAIEVLGTVSKLGFCVSVAASSPYKTLADLIAALKEKGDKGNYATTAPTGQVTGALLKEMAGLKTVEINYRTGGDTLNDLASGSLDFAMLDSTFAVAQERAGRVRLLAIGTRERLAAMPDVPSLHELGFKDVNVMSWWALMVPVGLPEPVKKKLSEAFAQMARAPKTHEFLKTAATDPFILGAEEAQKFFLQEIENWARYVKVAKIEVKG
jgi:tripartite-type tricarboxylate transporter receptor subunit TctC